MSSNYYYSALKKSGITPDQISDLEFWIDGSEGINAKASASFGGAGGQLSSSSLDFNPSTNSFSFGGWVKINTNVTNASFISKYNSTGNQRSYAIVPNVNQYRFFISSDGVSIRIVDIPVTNISTWNFVVFVYDSDSSLLKGSINNGTFVTTAHSDGAFISNENFIFGKQLNASSSPNNTIEGDIDGAFFTNEALKSNQINDLYNGGDGVNYIQASTIFSQLVDYWELNEFSGSRAGKLGHNLTDINSNVNSNIGHINEPASNDDPIYEWIDKSGNGHHLIQNTFISQPLWKQSGFGSNSKGYVQIDINDFMNIPNNINTDTDMTVIALVKKDIFNGSMQTLTSTLGGAYAYGSFGVDVYQRTRVGYRRLRCGQPPPLEFCAGYDTGEIITTNTATGLDLRFYKNGIETFYGYASVSSVRVDDFDLLCSQSGGNQGRIAEVIMYNRVLSSDERESIRNYLLNKYGTLTPHA